MAAPIQSTLPLPTIAAKRVPSVADLFGASRSRRPDFYGDLEVSIADIKKTVCAHFNLTEALLVGRRRDLKVARPRQIAMYLCSLLTQHSNTVIGHHLGDRDYSTVKHGIGVIEEMIAQNPAVAELVTSLRDDLVNGRAGGVIEVAIPHRLTSLRPALPPPELPLWRRIQQTIGRWLSF